MSTQSAAEIEAWLLDRLRERLGAEAEAIDPRLPFSYYGLDSLDAVALASELENWLGVPVAPDLAWDYPTAHAIAVYLSDAQSEGVEPVANREGADDTVAALLSELGEDAAS